MNPASNRETAHLDTTTRPARDSLSPGPPAGDSLSPRPGSGERVRQRGFQKRATNRWNVPLFPALSMNRTNSEYALPSKAAEDRRTPRRYRVGDSRAHFRQVLECAGPAALWIAQTGSWSQCTASKSWGLSMNRTNSEYALPSKAADDRRTPRSYRASDSRAHFRQVFECAGPSSLWIARTGSWSQS